MHMHSEVCACMAVARGDARTEVKGGAYSVTLHLSKHHVATLHLYRQVIAGAITQGLPFTKEIAVAFCTWFER